MTQELGRGGLRAALEAFDVGLDQPAARVEVERDPDRVVEDHLLRFLVALHARRPDRHRVGLVEQAVDGRVPIARGVAGGADVPAVEEHREEILGIGIVRDPALAEEAGAAVVHHLDVGGPVEAAQLERDADLL